MLAAGLVLALAAGLAGAAEESRIAPLAAQSLLLDAALAGDRLIAVGERGHLLTSDDGGRSWTQRRVPTRATLTGIDFLGDRFGVAVGHDATILVTADGGETWRLAHSDPGAGQPLLAVQVLDAQRAIAVGAYGLRLETSDGGVNWTAHAAGAAGSDGDHGAPDLTPDVEDPLGLSALDEGVDFDEDEFTHLNRIAVAEDGTLYTAGEAGTLHRSDDAGRTWRSLPSPYEGSFFGLLPLDGDALIVCGLRGHAFRSDDRGETWAPAGTGAQEMLADALRLDGERVLLAGLGGVVLLSRDGGRTFERVPREDKRGIWRVLRTPDGALLRVGEGGAERMALDGVD